MSPTAPGGGLRHTDLRRKRACSTTMPVTPMPFPDVEPATSAVPPVLVSACRLGRAVRHDGGHKHCGHPVLKAASPSCGSAAIHDGHFGGRRVPGQGVSARS